MEAKLIHVGKKGVTPELLREITDTLRKHKAVRIKMLKSARAQSGRGEISEQILGKIKARRSELRGNILTLGV